MREPTYLQEFADSWSGDINARFEPWKFIDGLKEMSIPREHLIHVPNDTLAGLLFRYMVVPPLQNYKLQGNALQAVYEKAKNNIHWNVQELAHQRRLVHDCFGLDFQNFYLWNFFYHYLCFLVIQLGLVPHPIHVRYFARIVKDDWSKDRGSSDLSELERFQHPLAYVKLDFGLTNKVGLVLKGMDATLIESCIEETVKQYYMIVAEGGVGSDAELDAEVKVKTLQANCQRLLGELRDARKEARNLGRILIPSKNAASSKPDAFLACSFVLYYHLNSRENTAKMSKDQISKMASDIVYGNPLKHDIAKVISRIRKSSPTSANNQFWIQMFDQDRHSDICQ